MKTIVQVLQHLKPGGLEVMALNLLMFSNNKRSMKIVSLEGSAEEAMEQWPRLRPFADQLIFLNKKPGFKPSLIKQLAELFKVLDADVVHTHHIGPYFYAGLGARLAGIKVIHTEHDAWHYSNNNHKTLHKIVSTFSKPTVVADADVVAKSLGALPGMDNIQVIKNGVDTYTFLPGDKASARAQLKLPKNGKLIGTSGRLEEVKGHCVLIDAMTLLPSNTHLAIAGSGSLKEALKNQVKSLGLESRVHFLGHVENMPTFYQSLDVFCLPSFNEGFPLAPLEAQSCGIPTAVTNVGGAVETLCQSTGTILKAGDAKDMAEKITLLLAERHQISPREHIIASSDIRKMAKAYDELAEGQTND
ncbi:glycosyltransferase [Enterovibrio sp. ZSDZ35]|uniref:Glycosyltransferase n=1 Tax=Enterovibrio qingdaonensis TaxID=2899818 RepID=A0ABT5QSJ0_9GAMM|nr:glycosyltransferase [Enterovibrio sp. ZSDZ35]MDD1783956.1 glycosyltransferase [Enterovibrio sp. ZSDZ35]